LYNNAIAREVAKMGFKAILTEGLQHILRWRSPDYVYRAKGSDIKVLLRNYGVSDEVGYLFTHKTITADDFAKWVSGIAGETCNIFIDYETFGEHQWRETGILEFLRHLPELLSGTTACFSGHHQRWRIFHREMRLTCRKMAQYHGLTLSGTAVHG